MGEASHGFAGNGCEDEITLVNIGATGRYNTPNNYMILEKQNAHAFLHKY